jgi:hypothetical protein
MFFIQQANSLKNSSQIAQRKDINKAVMPVYAMKQSRGGDISSQGGLTSATTALGNQQDSSISHENRSRTSGIEVYPPNATASFANNGFEHSISDKRIGGQQTTPTSKRDDKSASLPREKSHRDKSRSNSHNADGKPSAERKVTTEDAPNEAGPAQKGKNPYYFTFFNEKTSDGEKRERAPAEEPPKDAPDVFTLNYSTIDQVDVARRPTMQNILKGAENAKIGGSPEVPFRERAGQALTATKPTVSRAEKMQSTADPTPNFNSHKAGKLPTESDDVRVKKHTPSGRRAQHSGAGVLSSASGLGIQDGSFENISQGGVPSHEPGEGLSGAPAGGNQEKPSYTPVRRNQHNVRAKPQSPKILLPQCFLDQPLGPMISNAGIEAGDQRAKVPANAKPSLSKSRLKSQIDKVKPTGLPVLNSKDDDATHWKMESIGQPGHRAGNASQIVPTSKKSAGALSGLSHQLGPRQSLRDKMNGSNLNEGGVKEVKPREGPGRKASGVNLDRASMFGTHSVSQTRQPDVAATKKED